MPARPSVLATRVTRRARSVARNRNMGGGLLFVGGPPARAVESSRLPRILKRLRARVAQAPYEPEAPARESMDPAGVNSPAPRARYRDEPAPCAAFIPTALSLGTV